MSEQLPVPSQTPSRYIVEEAAPEEYVRARAFSEITKRNRLHWLKRWEHDLACSDACEEYTRGRCEKRRPLVLATRADITTLKERFEKLHNQSPQTYWHALKAYFHWCEEVLAQIYPQWGNPSKGIEISKGKEEAERPAMKAKEVVKLLNHVRKHGGEEEYWVLVLAGRFLMRSGEILPRSLSQPHRICDCPDGQECNNKEHDFIILKGGRVSFRRKGSPGKVRWSEYHQFTTEELKMLVNTILHPPTVAATFTRKLRRYCKELKIELRNTRGQKFENLTFHMLCRHTSASLLGRTTTIPTLMAIADVSGVNWARRYVHTTMEDQEEAKKVAFTEAFRLEGKS